MLNIKFISILLFVSFIGCSTDSGSDSLTKEELLIGSWKVTSAVIDSTNTPVTVPGLGQISATFTTTSYTYTYPEVNEQGQPTSNTASVTGTWSFNEDYSMLTLVPPANSNFPTLEWEIITLSIGILNTRFEQRSAADPTQTSTYEINYILD